MSSGIPTTVDTGQECFRSSQSVCSKVQSCSNNHKTNSWSLEMGLAWKRKRLCTYSHWDSLFPNHCRSVSKRTLSKDDQQDGEHLKEQLIYQYSWIMKTIHQPTGQKVCWEQVSCHLECVRCGDTHLVWLKALGRKSRSRDEWHVLLLLPGNQCVCPGQEEGKDIQVSWLPGVTGAAGLLSLWHQQLLPPHFEIQQKDRSGHWWEQREKSPMDHNLWFRIKMGGWWCLGAPAAAECALSTWELQPKQERKHYLLQKKVF